MLKLESIESSYGNQKALFGISIEIREGQVVTLMGRNGMGKTTTVRSIMGQVTINAGSIIFDGTELTQLEDYQIAKRGIGLVPEGRQIFPNLTIWENLVATAHNLSKSQQAWNLEKVFTLFPKLAERRQNMGDQLSGGEQQMLAIGRALMTNPKLLILDEATEGLAPLIRKEIWRCLERLKARGQSILLIDKNVKPLTRIGDYHYIIERGQVVWEGDSAEFSVNDDIKHRYLGI